MPSPSHPPSFDHPNNIFRRVQVMSCIYLSSVISLPSTKHSLDLYWCMPSQPGSSRQKPIFWECSLQKKVLPTTCNFPRRIYRSANLTQLSVFLVCMTLLQYYAGSKQPSYKITTMQMFATRDKLKEPHTISIRGLNLEAVRLTTVQVTKLSLQHRLKR
jgi:hypothetical protein